jgi:hypothetical protein
MGVIARKIKTGLRHQHCLMNHTYTDEHELSARFADAFSIIAAK